MRHFLPLLLCGGLAACSACAQRPTTTPATTSPAAASAPAPTPQKATPAQLHPLLNQKPQKPGKAQAVVKPAKKDVPAIVFKKTPCFGTCPHFDATIYPDGRVEYQGYHFVNLEGKHQLQLPAATVDAILQKANALHFSQLQSQYLVGTTDLPSTHLTLPLADGTTKTVVAEPSMDGRGAPAELQALFEYISSELDKITGGPAEK